MKWISDQAAMQTFVNTVKRNLHGLSQATIPGTHVAHSYSPPIPSGFNGSNDEATAGKIRKTWRTD